jgi:hypothetical protein
MYRKGVYVGIKGEIWGRGFEDTKRFWRKENGRVIRRWNVCCGFERGKYRWFGDWRKEVIY